MLNDLALTLKHVHWNVVGPNFIAVHTMLNPQVDAVRVMVDQTAERIATLGGSPSGTPGALVAQRRWDDYSIGRAGTMEHLAALDVVYAGIIEAQREAIETTEELDQVTHGMLVKHSGELEQFHWFVRAHLENADGSLATRGARTEKGAARQARAQQASVPESAEAAPVSARSAASGGLQTGQQRTGRRRIGRGKHRDLRLGL